MLLNHSWRFAVANAFLIIIAHSGRLSRGVLTPLCIICIISQNALFFNGFADLFKVLLQHFNACF